jgi:hypothetical protein
MMGQQQIMESAAALRRIMLVVLVAALMALVLVVMSASTALADAKGDTHSGANDKGYGLHNPDNGRPVDPSPPW